MKDKHMSKYKCPTCKLKLKLIIGVIIGDKLYGCTNKACMFYKEFALTKADINENMRQGIRIK
jgi:hypothetical protein